MKSGEEASRAKQALRRFDETHLPEYALKEFKAGALYAYVWLHNKFVQLKDFHVVIDAVQKMSRTQRRNLTSTALEALREAAKADSAVSSVELKRDLGPVTTDGRILARRYQLELKNLILRAWRKRRKATTRVTHALHCFSEGDILDRHGILELGRLDCQRGVDCALFAQLRDQTAEVKRILASDALHRTGRETEARRQALVLLTKGRVVLSERRACRSLGDAVFALLAPAGGVVLTTNLRDHKPLAEALGKRAEAP